MVTLKDFNERMEETNCVMAQNIARELYGPNALADYLERHGRKSVKWSWGAEVQKWRSRLGQLFLKAANALGEYNDSDY